MQSSFNKNMQKKTWVKHSKFVKNDQYVTKLCRKFFLYKINKNKQKSPEKTAVKFCPQVLIN